MIPLNTYIDFKTEKDHSVNFVKDVMGNNPTDITCHLGKVVKVAKDHILSGSYDCRLEGYPPLLECLVVDGKPGSLILTILGGPKAGSTVLTKETGLAI